MKSKSKFKLDKHILIPKHQKLSEKEKENVLAKYNITIKELPKIMPHDPAIINLNAKPGDIIKITRKSETAGEAVFYRGITNV